jgi:hypothetical protein
MEQAEEHEGFSPGTSLRARNRPNPSRVGEEGDELRGAEPPASPEVSSRARPPRACDLCRRKKVPLPSHLIIVLTGVIDQM